MSKPKMTELDNVASWLSLIGAINWGLVGFLSFDLVQWISALIPSWTWLPMALYDLIGISAVWLLYRIIKGFK